MKFFEGCFVDFLLVVLELGKGALLGSAGIDPLRNTSGETGHGGTSLAGPGGVTGVTRRRPTGKTLLVALARFLGGGVLPGYTLHLPAA